MIIIIEVYFVRSNYFEFYNPTIKLLLVLGLSEYLS